MMNDHYFYVFNCIKIKPGPQLEKKVAESESKAETSFHSHIKAANKPNKTNPENYMKTAE